MNLLLLSVAASLSLTPVLADSDHGGFWAPAGPGDGMYFSYISLFNPETY